jgi:hypothetical protein
MDAHFKLTLPLDNLFETGYRVKAVECTESQLFNNAINKKNLMNVAFSSRRIKRGRMNGVYKK